ncbi:MAG: PAC2 family protein [Anaerolineae bacterium]|jgi:predicted ATP-grasp superfamily ATP-dependent carboligase
MSDLFEIWEKPTADNIIMLAGWRQWADAGSISSKLPEYLIEQMQARKIGQFHTDGYYLFQIPGTHHLVRPVIKLEDGYRREFEERQNEIYYAGDEEKGIVIFLGDEPHMNVEQYGRAFFGAAQTLGVSTIIGLAGVYGAVPYDKDRQIHCIYSLPGMRANLEQYALSFSDYEGGSSIGSYLVHRAEAEAMPFLVFYGFVPAYDFSQSVANPQGLRLDQDYKAWYDIMRRVNHMFDLNIDLTQLLQQGEQLTEAMAAEIAEMEEKMPQLNIREYLEQLETAFTELSFYPLADVWENELRDLFADDEPGE